MLSFYTATGPRFYTSPLSKAISPHAKLNFPTAPTPQAIKLKDYYTNSLYYTNSEQSGEKGKEIKGMWPTGAEGLLSVLVLGRCAREAGGVAVRPAGSAEITKGRGAKGPNERWLSFGRGCAAPTATRRHVSCCFIIIIIIIIIFII